MPPLQCRRLGLRLLLLQWSRGSTAAVVHQPLRVVCWSKSRLTNLTVTLCTRNLRLLPWCHMSVASVNNQKEGSHWRMVHPSTTSLCTLTTSRATTSRRLTSAAGVIRPRTHHSTLQTLHSDTTLVVANILHCTRMAVRTLPQLQTSTRVMVLISTISTRRDTWPAAATWTILYSQKHPSERLPLSNYTIDSLRKVHVVEYEDFFCSWNVMSLLLFASVISDQREKPP